MKTTNELSDAAFRHKNDCRKPRHHHEAVSAVAPEEKIRRDTQETQTREAKAPWMAGFGALSDLVSENRRILRLIDKEFEEFNSEDTTRS